MGRPQRRGKGIPGEQGPQPGARWASEQKQMPKRGDLDWTGGNGGVDQCRACGARGGTDGHRRDGAGG